MGSPNDQTRRAILDAAERLFACYGFKKTSIEDVAREARIGKGTVYLHFSSKEALFAEIVQRISDQMFRELEEAVERARTPAEKVRAFVETRLTEVAEMAEAYRLNEETVFEILPLVAGNRDSHRRAEHALLERILREGAASGALVVPRPRQLADGIIACLYGLDATSFRMRGRPEAREALQAFLDVFLRGLSARESPVKR